MELHFPSFSVLLAFLLFLFMVMKKGMKGSNTQNPNSKLPPGPPKLPLIGNLHNMLGGLLPHHTLRDLSKKYGPLMHLQLGEVSAVVVSSPKVAEQFLKTHDLNFADRPQLLAANVVFHGCTDVAFASYGNYWRQMRKIAVLEFLSTKRVNSFRSIREEEVSNMIQSISLMAGLPINLTEIIYSLTNDITSRAAFGKKCKEKEAFISAMREVSKLAAGLDVSDLFPSLKFLHVLSGTKPKLEWAHRKVDKILNDIINDHRENRTSTISKPNRGHDQLEEDLVDVLLRLQESATLEPPVTTDNLKAFILDLFAAGTESASAEMEWVMSELLKNPRVMEKAQAEVRRVFNGERQIDETNIHKLDYVKLVIKETLRLRPAGPLLVPRECRERCEIDGYEIPLKTKVFVNVWAIGRDSEYWNDAESFEPERFHGSSIDYKGADFEYLPFGAGRRMCPGVSFGIANMELALAQLLYHFDWKLPGDGVKPEDTDMSESFGLSVRRRDPLYLIPIPYIPLATE
ncbi:Cytochrome P450 [Macleaya cordata]|uniref:Cytochrome P450 n=1 Tax=Macleaya cordata TaxID=56857 RepID=A0A200R8L3_MACCD|nr:Cytochrome P450 [Macleaya cordata]